MLATNMSGKDVVRFSEIFGAGAYLFFLAPVTVAGPQFM